MLIYRYDLSVIVVHYGNDTPLLITELIAIMCGIPFHSLWMLYDLLDLICRQPSLPAPVTSMF